MSSRLPFLVLLFFLMLFSPLDITMAGRNSPSRVAQAARPLEPKSQDYTTLLKPRPHRERNVFRGREVKSCLPKGIRRSSAPSRYVNYQTFDATTCSLGRRHSKP
uniref:Uncharacterized protein n=1 Tax=Nelumbo nucifera TaxID=4432 RepID=A0A822Y6J1_NELNU|nr:TPA_asm: hypothetical protein HUJ06_028254 [Nelumbo nucifera]